MARRLLAAEVDRCCRPRRITAAATVLTQVAAKMRVDQMMKTMAYANRREEGWLLMTKIIATKGAAETVMVVLLVVEEKKRWR